MIVFGHPGYSFSEVRIFHNHHFGPFFTYLYLCSSHYTRLFVLQIDFCTSITINLLGGSSSIP